VSRIMSMRFKEHHRVEAPHDKSDDSPGRSAPAEPGGHPTTDTGPEGEGGTAENGSAEGTDDDERQIPDTSPEKTDDGPERESGKTEEEGAGANEEEKDEYDEEDDDEEEDEDEDVEGRK